MKISSSESQMGNETDDYLIELMGLKSEFPAEAMEAYGKIYSRYWDVMFIIAKRATQDDDSAGDLLADTFNMIYNKASTFKLGKIRNASNVRLSIQNWMTSIMKRIFYDHFLDEAYKKSSDEEELEESYIIDKKLVAKYIGDDYDDFIEQIELSEERELLANDDAPVDNINDSSNITKINQYLKTLSNRDRDIILTTYNYYIPGKYTPASVLTELEEKWQTTKQNIRKILEKFRKSIKEELQPVMFIRK